MTERILVRDLMSVGVQTCSADAAITDIARLLLENDLEAVVVLDEDGQGIGLVGQDELVKAYAQDNYRDLSAEEAMTDGVPHLPPDIPLSAAAQLMQDKGVRVAYYMHNAAGIIYPASVISYRHFLRHMAANNDNELNDLGIKAVRQSPLDAFIKKRDEARQRNQTFHQE
jgi:predicted transcriptional regulator